MSPLPRDGLVAVARLSSAMASLLALAGRSAGQEILDQPREFRRLLHLGHVTAILDHDKPRARDGTLIDLAAIDWRDRVLASPQQQCRSTDARQQMTQGEAVHVGFPRDPAGHFAVLLDEIGLLGRPLVP